MNRGFEQVLYLKDPNGITLELTNWLTPLPAIADHAMVLKTAHRMREDQGASYIDAQHIQQALTFMYGTNSTAPVPL